jgi:rSAM/selenodomain-associated transferase 2
MQHFFECGAEVRHIGSMITVVIPTLNEAAYLVRCFNSLLQATMSGIVREVIVSDGGSADETLLIADAAGAHVVSASRSRGAQLARGAEIARGDWLLFLHANTVLEPGWEAEALAFMERTSIERPCAAAFRLGLDDFSSRARRIETFVGLRSRFFALPYGDQGLLIPARLYFKLGGFKPVARMEDVDFARRLGRSRLVHLRARAITDAARFRKENYFRRSLRSLGILFLCALRVPTPLLARLSS